MKKSMVTITAIIAVLLLCQSPYSMSETNCTATLQLTSDTPPANIRTVITNTTISSATGGQINNLNSTLQSFTSPQNVISFSVLPSINFEIDADFYVKKQANSRAVCTLKLFYVLPGGDSCTPVGAYESNTAPSVLTFTSNNKHYTCSAGVIEAINPDYSPVLIINKVK